MKKNILSIVVLVAMMVLPMNIFAQVTASVASVPTKARVIKAIKLETTGELNFGTFTSSTSGGTITMTPTGEEDVFTRVSSDPTNLALLESAGAQNIASLMPTFKVSGEASYTYSIAIDNITTLTSTQGGTAMSVAINANKLGTDITTGTLSGTLFADVAAGTESFSVKGVLTVGADQKSGDYAGTFGVTVAYN